jgi:hypothetical protein
VQSINAGPILEEQAIAAIPQQGWLKGYVKWASQATDANLAYHLVAGLTVLSQSVPIDYCVPFGLSIYMPIYGLLVGNSTDSRKSTAIELARRMVKLAMPDRHGAAFGSAESIVDELHANPQQIVFLPEYSSLLAQAEKGYANAIKTKLTEAYDSAPMSRRKANGKGVTVETPRLSLLCGIAPGYIEKHTEGVDWSEGFLARHFTILASRARYIETPVNNVAWEEQLVKYLQGLLAAGASAYEVGGYAPCDGLTPGAAKLRAEWQANVAKIAADVKHKEIAPGIGRASGMVLKAAGLLAWDWGRARTGFAWKIDDEAMAAALKIVDLHVQSVLAIGEWLAPDKAMRDRRRLLTLIDAKPIRRGALWTEAKMTKRDGTHLLETLIEENVIRVAHVVNGEPYYVRVGVTERRGAFYTAPEPVFDDAIGPPPGEDEVPPEAYD